MKPEQIISDPVALNENNALAISFSIESQMENTVMIAMAVRGICALTSLPEKEVGRIELCVTEVVNNAIEHAYNYEKNNKVTVTVTLLLKKNITIHVTDSGRAMPSTSVLQKDHIKTPDPNDPATWKTSGQGLGIVNKIMDNVKYSVADNKNTFSMSYSLS